MDDCVFCRIIGGELPCLKVYENELALVFMDIARDVDGHMVAIPKKHVRSLLDCDGETLNGLMAAVKTVAEHLVSHCGYSGVNLLNASGESAGQSVPHFHIHLIPRREDDGINAWPAFGGADTAPEELYSRVAMK